MPRSFKAIIVLNILAVIFATLKLQSQGITYVTSLNHSPNGNTPVGSDRWFAQDFFTGSNPGGYTLNSIQVAMLNASGNPNGFSVMLYSSISIRGGTGPGGDLWNLSGSVNPATAGTYSYGMGQDITLASGTEYWLVLTSATAAATGAYNWSAYNIGSKPEVIGGWFSSYLFQSPDGSAWNTASNAGGQAQYAINATPVPEPSAFRLLLLGGGVLVLVRKHLCQGYSKQ